MPDIEYINSDTNLLNFFMNINDNNIFTLTEEVSECPNNLSGLEGREPSFKLLNENLDCTNISIYEYSVLKEIINSKFKGPISGNESDSNYSSSSDSSSEDKYEESDDDSDDDSTSSSSSGSIISGEEEEKKKTEAKKENR